MAVPNRTPAEKKRSPVDIWTGFPTSSALAKQHAPAVNTRRFFPAPGMSPSRPKTIQRGKGFAGSGLAAVFKGAFADIQMRGGLEAILQAGQSTFQSAAGNPAIDLNQVHRLSVTMAVLISTLWPARARGVGRDQYCVAAA